MLHTTKAKANRKTGPRKSRVRFPGICADASALGVHRISLYRTLTGAWHLPGLLKRYRALKGAA